jgi:hypothetical protein
VTLDVNALWRRPPGPRVLVYLDQSTLSALVTEERFADVREQLRAAMYDDRLVCPTSLEHTGETIPARNSWEDITKLADELSMGVDFRPEQELRAYEVRAAAELFFEGQGKREVWQEAFKTDPHTPRETLFPGGFRVHAYFPPDEWRLTEVENLRQTELDLERIYEEARRQGYSFEQQVEREFEAMVEWVLGPLVDGGKMQALYERRKAELVQEGLHGEWDPSPGSTMSHFLATSEHLAGIRSLVERFPQLEERAPEFAGSEIFRNMPALRYPPILRAAIAVMSGRKPQRGDGHDIVHLTRGLSRCDIVTADAGMTQLCVNHRLVPEGCTLVRFNDVTGLSEAIARALETPPPAPGES